MERIKKEDWDEINLKYTIIGVEMQNGNKYYLNHNVDGFVNINLKKNIESEYSDTDDLESGMNSMKSMSGCKKVFKFDTMQEMINWATS